MKVKLLFIFALLLTVATGAWAQGPTWLRDGDTWDDATKTLTVKSNPVVGAYREIAEIEIVIFDTSVTSIGTNAFDGCTGLTDITIPDGVTTIGSDAFISCT